MSGAALSPRERQTISDILTDAEFEFIAPRQPYESIEAIDIRCKSLWPQWTPGPIRVRLLFTVPTRGFGIRELRPRGSRARRMSIRVRRR
jgi:hypothetical protein